MKIRKYLPAIGVSYLLFFVLAFVTGLYSPLGVIVKFQFGISMGAAQLGTLANFLGKDTATSSLHWQRPP